MATPLYDLSFLPPGRMTLPRIIGGVIEGGTSLSGVQLAADLSGGGLVAVDYADIQIGNTNRDRMLFASRLRNVLQGGVRSIVVPLLTDWIAPCKDSAISLSGGAGARAPFSDGSTFSDGSEFAQAPVSGTSLADYVAGDSTIHLTVIGGRALQGGEWFGINHVSKGFRAYTVTDVDSEVAFVNGNFNFSVGIRPPLRDVLAQDQQIDWWRPRCLMRLAPGSAPDLEVAPYWWSTPTIKFVEAV